MEKLAFSLVISARKLWPYFQAHTIIMLTNQPLRQMLSRPKLSRRMLKWAIELTAFHIECRPQPAIKTQALADFIAEGIGSQEVTEQDQRPWILAVDGSSTSCGGGAGLMIRSPDGQEWPYALNFEFRASNNEADYEALLAGLRLATQLGVQRIEVSSDSNLVVQQVNGEYEARESHMATYLAMARELIARFQSIKVEYVPRAMNTKANMLSQIAPFSFPKSSRQIRIDSLPQKSIEEFANQLCVEHEPSWVDPLLLYLKEEKLSKDDSEAQKVRRKARSFLLVNEELYKRSFSQPLLKCIKPCEADYILREIHEGICGSHIRARTLSQKALWQGYYWPTMVKDLEQLVRTCDKCQRTSNLVHVLVVTLTHLATPCPFSQWGIDILGPFPPVAGQVRYIIAAIDYFTKWVEAELVASITARQPAYNRRIERYYNRRVKTKSFLPGDWVLRRADVRGAKEANKLTPNWEGPFKVMEALSPQPSALALTNSRPPRVYPLRTLGMCRI
ncbi:uncharacterized protein LOC127804425 [Diospyros lotus]|uniref:uncharacterized protein LOC127804425 n=1 Tax=Diospyros lotus TaxID=55363 RepID=UPI002256EAD3|nr:uncharacterized protein LOC127804425 [Diospyros lotus]